jgi:hypothetical protein
MLKPTFRIRLLVVTFLSCLLTFPPSFSFAAGLLRKRAQYHVDPRKRQQIAVDNLLKAMQLNMQVTQMIMQKAGNPQEMSKMLQASYGHQVKSLNEMQGILREADLKDPMLDQAIKLMYRKGKPYTARAETGLHQKPPNFQFALRNLEISKKTHNQVLQIIQTLAF